MALKELDSGQRLDMERDAALAALATETDARGRAAKGAGRYADC